MEKTKRFYLIPALCLFLVFFVAAGVFCAEPPEEPVPPQTPQFVTESRTPIFQYLPESSRMLGTELALSNASKEIAGKVYYELKEEGEQSLAGKVAVVSAVPLSDFKRETEFGRLMAEYLLTDLADRGLQVDELRLGREITILPQTGEFILTRNAGELANVEPALDYVVLSTYSNTRKALIVQGRLVALKDGTVKTSWRFTLPMNRDLIGLFHAAPEAPFTIAIKGIE